ncbi:MAG TPA: hypothetical protein DCM14_00325 [Clostridiales bacterium UBA8153]|nr:hypothetical protein [Clostridiales bacterium UBA8153]
MRRDYGRRRGTGWTVHRETRTEAELGRALRARGLAFEREVPIDNFVVDFLLGGRLVVEVDGVSHLPRAKAELGVLRDRRLCSLGFEVLHVPAEDIATGGAGRWAERIAALLVPGKVEALTSEQWKAPLAQMRAGLAAEELRRAARRRGEDRAQAPVVLGPVPDREETPSMAELFKPPTGEDFAALLAQSPDAPPKDGEAPGRRPRRRR